MLKFFFGSDIFSRKETGKGRSENQYLNPRQWRAIKYEDALAYRWKSNLGPILQSFVIFFIYFLHICFIIIYLAPTDTIISFVGTKRQLSLIYLQLQ
jgi:hypothetical protein